MDISVVIPAFNEELRISTYLSEVFLHFKQLKLAFEILVVDDGSTDSTADVVESFAGGHREVKLIRLSCNRGKGAAVKAGMLKASGKVRLFADADGATPIVELATLTKAIENGADIAIASRVPGPGVVVQADLHRKVMGTVFNTLVRLFLFRGINDTQCGFKLFTAEAATTVFPLQRLEGFGFDIELLYIGRKKGYRIAVEPVNWTERKGSKVRLVADSWAMFTDIFRVRGNDLLGHYDEGFEASAMMDEKP